MTPDDRSGTLLRHLVQGDEVHVGDEVGAWIDHAATQRIIPLLHHACGDARLDLQPRETNESVLDAQLQVMSAMVRFEHDLLQIGAALDAAGITWAVLKGFATAHLDYPDPSMRQSADVDLLVAPAELAHALEVLGGLGWSQAYALPRDHLEFTHAVTLRNERHVEVDLHQRIGHRALGRLVPTDELLAARRPFEIAGRRLHALSDADRVIHAGLHEATSRNDYHHLSSTADVLVLTQRHRALAGDVVERCDRWRIAAVFERGIRDAWATARLPLPDEWTVALGRSRRSRSRLVDHAYLGDARRPGAEEIAHLVSIPGWAARRRYLAGYLRTDPDYAAQTGRSGLRAQASYLWSRLRDRGSTTTSAPGRAS